MTDHFTKYVVAVAQRRLLLRRFTTTSSYILVYHKNSIRIKEPTSIVIWSKNCAKLPGYPNRELHRTIPLGMGLPNVSTGPFFPCWELWIQSKNTIVCSFVYSHTSNFSAIWWLSPLPVTGLQILGLCSALGAFKQGGIFIVSHLLRHGTSVYTVSSETQACRSISICVQLYSTRFDSGKHIIRLKQQSRIRRWNRSCITTPRYKELYWTKKTEFS
jgi:hypothetical protein